MITRFALLSGRLLVAFAFLFTVTACGGGGGSGGSFVPDQDGPESYFLALTLIDEDGNETNSVATGAPTTLRAKVTRNGKNGKVVANVVVTVETTAGTISPASGTALTDVAGIATFRVQVDANTKGAGTLTASADNDNGSFTGSIGFQVGNDGLRLGYIDENGLFIENQIKIQPDSPIASKAVAELSVVIADEEGNIVSSAETVSFDSGCIASGQAVLDPANPLISGDGRISTSYRAAGCSGNDAITVSLEGSSGQAFGTVTVASSRANGLIFVSAAPNVIVLRDTGGNGGARPESSIVTFRVEDRDNAPLSGINVDFSLTNETGGVSLSPETAVSGSDGLVNVNVFSGDTPTQVRVIATTTAGDGSGQNVSTVSDILSVSTGLPSQDSINLNVEGGGFIIENGFTTDGISRTLNLSMLDNFGNPVPDGTTAAFRTEYGAIDPFCQTVDGKCSVTWTSEAPRLPLLTGDTYLRQVQGSGYNCPGYSTNNGPCPSDLSYTRGGRSTVLVTATGEESFIDRNDNGIMDEDEKDLFTNLGEAFLDKNEDGIFNPATATCQGAGADSRQCIAGEEETLVDFNNNGKYDKNNPPVYNGLQCPPEGDGVWCSRKLVDVRSSTVLTLSQPSQWYVSLFSGTTSVSIAEAGRVYTVAVSDIYNNRPPKGYSVRISGSGSCNFFQADFLIQDSAQIGAYLSDQFAVEGEGTESSKLNVTLTSDSGIELFTKPFSCKPLPPPVDPNDPGDGLVVGAG